MDDMDRAPRYRESEIEFMELDLNVNYYRCQHFKIKMDVEGKVLYAGVFLDNLSGTGFLVADFYYDKKIMFVPLEDVAGFMPFDPLFMWYQQIHQIMTKTAPKQYLDSVREVYRLVANILGVQVSEREEADELAYDFYRLLCKHHDKHRELPLFSYYNLIELELKRAGGELYYDSWR